MGTVKNKKSLSVYLSPGVKRYILSKSKEEGISTSQLLESWVKQIRDELKAKEAVKRFSDR